MIQYDPINDQLDITFVDKEHIGEPYQHDTVAGVEICHCDEIGNNPQVISISKAAERGFWPISIVSYGDASPIRHFRKKYGLTQSEMGLVLGVTKARISQLENDPSLSLENFERVRSALVGLAAGHWAHNKVTSEIILN